jgi:hypothetical protein
MRICEPHLVVFSERLNVRPAVLDKPAMASLEKTYT